MYEEFFKQGDIEKSLGRVPQPILDREKAPELPKMQVSLNATLFYHMMRPLLC